MTKSILTRRDIEKLSHHKQVLLACFCAEQVIHLIKEEYRTECVKAVQTAYLFLEGKATQEECYAASNVAADVAAAAYTAATTVHAADAIAADAAAAAAYTVSDVGDATISAVNAATNAVDAVDAESRSSTIEAQWNFYDQLLNTDKYFEEIVLGWK